MSIPPMSCRVPIRFGIVRESEAPRGLRVKGRHLSREANAGLRQDLPHDPAGDVGETEVAAVEAIGELLVFQAQ